jgi:hypothetical protein
VYEEFYEDAFKLEEILKNMNVEILRAEEYVLKLQFSIFLSTSSIAILTRDSVT